MIKACFVVIGLLTASACGGGAAETPAAQGSATADRPREAMLESERCADRGGQVASVDVNNDGRPDIHHVSESGRLFCTEYDINFDGRADARRFYQSDGQTSRREDHDFDFDGRFDQIAFFDAAGVVERKELDTNFDSRVDSWIWCQEGRVIRSERDRRHRGHADTWEDYRQGVLSEARYDDNNDGRPEKWEVFFNGRLFEVRYDTNGDGQADRGEEVSSAGSSNTDPPVSCDGRVLPAPTPEENPPALLTPPAAAGATEPASTPQTEAPAPAPAETAPTSGGENSGDNWDEE